MEPTMLLTTDEMVGVVDGHDGLDLTYRVLDYWTRLKVIAPHRPADGSGVRRGWHPDQARVVAVLARLRSMGARTPVLRAVARTVVDLPPGAWRATLLVTFDGRVIPPLSSNEHGWLIRFSRCHPVVDVVRQPELRSA